MGRGDEDLAPAREFVGKRLAECVERAPVDLDLPDDRVDAVVRVDVPAVAETGGAPDGDVGVRADPDRRMRLLHRLGRAGSALEGEVRADHVDRLLGPQAADRGQVLLEALDRKSTRLN